MPLFPWATTVCLGISDLNPRDYNALALITQKVQLKKTQVLKWVDFANRFVCSVQSSAGVSDIKEDVLFVN